MNISRPAQTTLHGWLSRLAVGAVASPRCWSCRVRRPAPVAAVHPIQARTARLAIPHARST